MGFGSACFPAFPFTGSHSLVTAHIQKKKRFIKCLRLQNMSERESERGGGRKNIMEKRGRSHVDSFVFE